MKIVHRPEQPKSDNTLKGIPYGETFTIEPYGGESEICIRLPFYPYLMKTPKNIEEGYLDGEISLVYNITDGELNMMFNDATVEPINCELSILYPNMKQGGE